MIQERAMNDDRPAFKIADIHLSDLGRKEIRLAEHEMPGLMALRQRHAGKRRSWEVST
jgi:adenosylhomocysteinase